MAFWDREDQTEWEKYQRSQKRARKPAPAIGTDEPEGGEQKPGLTEQLRSRFRRSKAEAPPPPPEPCPWCGGEMELGYLSSNSAFLTWMNRKPNALLGRLLAEEQFSVCDDDWGTAYKTCHLCRTCEKIVMAVSLPKPAEPQQTQDTEESQD